MEKFNLLKYILQSLYILIGLLCTLLNLGELCNDLFSLGDIGLNPVKRETRLIHLTEGVEGADESLEDEDPTLYQVDLLSAEQFLTVFLKNYLDRIFYFLNKNLK